MNPGHMDSGVFRWGSYIQKHERGVFSRNSFSAVGSMVFIRNLNYSIAACSDKNTSPQD